MIVIGLMSGTSADGVDVAVCEITGSPPDIHLKLLQHTLQPYAVNFQARIIRACSLEHGRVDELCRLSSEIGYVFADAVKRAVNDAHLSLDVVDLIGSHGQTFWHDIGPDGQARATLQLGEASVIAEETGVTMVSNFRPRDIAAGGQGAPLVSYVDWLLLRHPTQWRAVQNIGGIGNVTFLPPLNDSRSAPLAFDTGPGNMLMDAAAVQLLGTPVDLNGATAARGQIDEAWLSDLLAHPYLNRRPPKTTGRELYTVKMARELVDTARQRGLSDEAILATLTALTAWSIADAYERFAPAPVAEVILGGGGRRNPTLVKMLRDALAPAAVLSHEEVGLNSDAKEALSFALLAYETWHGRPGTHPVLTGARHASVLGQITPGQNYIDLLKRTWA
jgi:anhydro-N-acetylmuramic acid kinase